jgi:cytoskeletal protein RodZ
MSKALFPGERLRARREELGLTLAQVHEHIHVPTEHIRALEEGALDRLPTYAYSMGFINSYCLLLEIPPDPFLVQFRSATHRHQQATSRRDTFQTSPLMDRELRPVWLAEAIAWGAICGMLILGWVAYSTIVQPFAEAGDSRVEAGTAPISAPLLHFPEEDIGGY